MKTRLLIVIGVSILVGVILLSSFSIQKDDESYVLFCTHWIFSDRTTCKVLWNESDRNTPVMKSTMSEESWDHFLSLPRETALEELKEKFDKHSKFFMDVTITGLKDSYVIGEKPVFTVVEAGYGIPCTHPHITVSKNGDDKPHWEYRFVHSCPFFKDGHPILSFMRIPSNNIIMPPITESGEYTISAASYDSSISKQFIVQESDFVYDYTLRYITRGNGTGNTTMEINLNDGNFAIEKNAKVLRNVLSSDELSHFKQLIDDGDLLRGQSNIHYGSDPVCRDCVSYTLMISLGDYTHSAIWQSTSVDLWENHVPIITAVEKLVNEQT